MVILLLWPRGAVQELRLFSYASLRLFRKRSWRHSHYDQHSFCCYHGSAIGSVKGLIYELHDLFSPFHSETFMSCVVNLFADRLSMEPDYVYPVHR